MKKNYDIILTHGSSITGVDLSEEDVTNILKSIQQHTSVQTNCKGKDVIINSDHIIMVKEI